LSKSISELATCHAPNKGIPPIQGIKYVWFEHGA